MGFLDFFKRKKEKTKPSVKSIKAKKPVQARVSDKGPKLKPIEESAEPVKAAADKAVSKLEKRKSPKKVYQVLRSPHVTEKATKLAEKNKYVFKIWPGINKIGIKEAVESIYNVDVEEIKIVNVPKKRRRKGRISGWRKGYKKAIVEIKEGQKIEILPR